MAYGFAEMPDSAICREGGTYRPDLRIDDVVKTFASFGKASGIQKGAHPGRAKMTPGAYFMRCPLAYLYPSHRSLPWGGALLHSQSLLVPRKRDEIPSLERSSAS